jgi:hypothetical protein
VLPHPLDDGSQSGDPNYWLSTIMAVFWDYPDMALINSSANPEKITLLHSPFFLSEKQYIPLVHR